MENMEKYRKYINLKKIKIKQTIFIKEISILRKDIKNARIFAKIAKQV